MFKTDHARLRAMLLVSSALGASSFASMAMAQAAPPANNGALEEVVVTATR